MKTIKVRGLVLREYEAGEADKRLLLLCKGLGRVLAYARGARKPRSKFIASAQIFTYSDFVLAKGKGFYSVAQADVIENFYNLRTDYDRLCAAHSIVNVSEKTLLEESNCDALLLLTLKSLSYLAKGNFSPLQIESVFLFRFFDFYGLRPYSDECAVCSLPVSEMDGEIFWGPEGIHCASHKTNLPVSAATIAAVSHILNNELISSFRFTASENVLEELKTTSKFLWENHFSNIAM